MVLIYLNFVHEDEVRAAGAGPCGVWQVALLLDDAAARGQLGAEDRGGQPGPGGRTVRLRAARRRQGSHTGETSELLWKIC